MRCDAMKCSMFSTKLTQLIERVGMAQEEQVLKVTKTKYGKLFIGLPGKGGSGEGVQIGDAVNHPSHYTQGGIETIEGIRAATQGLNGFEGYCTGNAVKYLWRWKHKNKVQDLKKAQWYINKLIEELEGE